MEQLQDTVDRTISLGHIGSTITLGHSRLDSLIDWTVTLGHSR